MEAFKKGVALMPTKFKYKMFPDTDELFWNMYKTLGEVSVLDLNHGQPIKEQWDELTPDEQWYEFVYALKVTIDLYNDLIEAEKPEDEKTKDKKLELN